MRVLFSEKEYNDFLIDYGRVKPADYDVLMSDEEHNWHIRMGDVADTTEGVHGFCTHLIRALDDHDVRPICITSSRLYVQRIAQHAQFLLWQRRGYTNSPPLVRYRRSDDREDKDFHYSPEGPTLYLGADLADPDIFWPDVEAIEDTRGADLLGAVLAIERARPGRDSRTWMETLEADGLFGFAMTTHTSLVSRSRERIIEGTHKNYALTPNQRERLGL